MTALRRKLVRDMTLLRGQAIAIALVMACGVATFIMSRSMLDSLTGTLDAYYDQHRFADVFSHVKRAPDALAERVAAIDGVAHVDARVVERVLLRMPGLTEPASGQVVSLPEDPAAGLNLVHLRAGRLPEGRFTNEVLVSERFALAHDLQPGDTIDAVLGGRQSQLRVAGIALSPEYIYLIGPGSIFPENERYGVFWMARDDIEVAFDMEGAFNDLAVSLAPGAQSDDVIDSIDDLAAPYGSTGAYERADQLSHQFVANEIEELRNMTLMVPAIFLAVAAFLLNIVLARLIATQREQIAVLKALGYSRLEVGRHYFGFPLLITLGAAVLGTTIGALMGRGMTSLYAEFFNFPTFDYVLHPSVTALGFGVSLAAGGVGVAHALIAVMRLPPAEAMRPPTPTSFRPTWIERAGLHRIVPTATRMVLRQLERTPIKTALAVSGIALATAILVVGRYAQDAIDYLVDFQFNRVQRYELDVAFAETTDNDARSTIAHLPGVLQVEPYRGLAARIRYEHRDRRVSVLGLDRPDGLYQLLDMSGAAVELPSGGIVISSILADVLDIGLGDEIDVEALEGRRTKFRAPVSGIIEDFSGLACYMRLDELNGLMREQQTVGGMYVTLDPQHLETIYDDLRDMPSVAAVSVKSAVRANFRDTVARSMGMMNPFLVGFSVIIAFGVVYNGARISLSERQRDLATLRVIGFTRREVISMQVGELAIVTGIAIPIGLLAGYGLAWLTATSVDSELLRMPFIIAPATFAFAGVIVAVASLISASIVRRRLNRLDLVSVLKSRE